MEYKPRDIICPKCSSKVGTYDGRSKINKFVKCKKCNKLVIYDTESGKHKLRPIPERTSGSGMRFY